MSEKLCERCEKNPMAEEHPCPFAQEVHNDNNERYCVCCDDCTNQCADDV